MEFKGLIFDFDGTIVDSALIFAACINDLREEFGYGRMERGRGLRGMSTHDVLTGDMGLTEESIPRWAEKLKALLRVRLREALTFKGMREVVTRLGTQFRLGILTSNSENVVRISLRGRLRRLRFHLRRGAHP